MNDYITFNMYNYLVEFFGSVLFIFVILQTGNPIAIGLTLGLLILISANVSGGHFNPAVSIVMAAAGKISTVDLIPYIVSQVFGGLVALELYKRYRL